MPDRFVEAMDRQTAALDKLVVAFEKSHRTGRRISVLQATLILIGVLLLWVTFSIRSTQGDSHNTLRIIQNATSAKAQAANQRATANAVTQLIQAEDQRANCINNHLDRALSFSFDKPVPAREAGCPPDQLP